MAMGWPDASFPKLKISRIPPLGNQLILSPHARHGYCMKNSAGGVLTPTEGSFKSRITVASNAAVIFLTQQPTADIPAGIGNYPPNPGSLIHATNWDVSIIGKFTELADCILYLAVCASDITGTGAGANAADNSPFVTFTGAAIYKSGVTYRIYVIENVQDSTTASAFTAATAYAVNDLFYLRFVRNGDSYITEYQNFMNGDKIRVTGTASDNFKTAAAKGRGACQIGPANSGGYSVPFTFDIYSVKAKWSG